MIKPQRKELIRVDKGSRKKFETLPEIGYLGNSCTGNPKRGCEKEEE